MPFNHLRLREWPFSVVPRPEHCTFIAGRPTLRAEVNVLTSTLARHPASSINVLWAWFGAGKTHTLHYLSSRFENITSETLTQIVPIYTELPKAVRSFLDLYETFVRAISLDELLNAFMEASTAPVTSATIAKTERAVPNLFTFLRQLVLGTHKEIAIATTWLHRGQISTSDLRRLGLTGKITSTDEAVRTLSAIVHIFQYAAVARGFTGGRVVWMIDEFQRINAGRAVANDVNVGLHSLFNANPVGLSLVLSFSGPPERKLPAWFSPEIRDRIGSTRIMILPPLSQGDALNFIRDVLEHFRTTPAPPNPYFPFTEKASRAIIDVVASQTELKPRILMQSFGAVLEAADHLIETDQIAEIDEAFAKEILATHVIVSDTEQDASPETD